MKQARIVVASDRLPTETEPARALRQLHDQLDASWVSCPERGYDAYASTVLWPLFHYLLDRVQLDANESWRAYVEANERVAHALAAETQPFDTVWIHDYQLALVPMLLRQLVPSARIGFFLHIPWPSCDVYRILPACRQILSGVLGADLVGFQTDNDRQNFLQAASGVLGLDATDQVLPWQGRAVHSGVYPIGIDLDAFAHRSVQLDAAVDVLREETRGKQIVLGVDRLDYTRGVPQRLLAIDRLLACEPGLRDRLHYVQLAMPVPEHNPELRRDVGQLVARINSQYGSATGSPVQLLYQSLPLEQLIALYRASCAMLVTPLREGMDLVAKEYVAARTDGLGCLVLSEFAGAASELTAALHVNPYDTPALASTIHRALAMPETEQRTRMRELRAVVADRSVLSWAALFLSDLHRSTRLWRVCRGDRAEPENEVNCGQKLTAATAHDVASDLAP